MIHCPSCAAGLRFDIESQKLVCDHCDSSFDVQSVRDNEKDGAKTAEGYDAYVFICPSCGAELLTNDQNDAVGFCPYCGGASMIYDRVRKNWTPGSIIPFQITKDQCRKAYLNEARKHLLVSSKYKRASFIDSFRGIYMPYWSYNVKHKGYYQFEHEEINGDNIDTVKETYSIGCEFQGYSHDASVSFDDRISENLAPYTELHRTGFHPGYLSGFYAEIGDADEQEYKSLVMERMSDNVRDKVTAELNKEGLRSVKNLTDIPTSVHSSELSLHPVWFMSYREKNRITYAAVNGETGKVSADFPLSPLRIIFFALLVSGLIFALISGLMSFLPSVKGNAALAVCSLLAIAGSYFLQRSFTNTVHENLRLDTAPLGSSGIVFGVATACSVIGSLMVMNDGSYAQAQASFGRTLLFPSIIAMIWMLVKQFRYQGRLKTELVDSLKGKQRDSFAPLANRCFPLFIAAQIICLIFSVFFIITAYADMVAKDHCYHSICLLAGLAFLTALLHIFFQLQAAKRRPPQMEKKGALYDEN